MKIGIVIQAQLGKNESLRDSDLFCMVNGQTVLETVIEKAVSCDVDKIIVLTSKGNKECEKLNYIEKNNIKVYVKEEISFVESYRKICLEEQLDTIIRIIGNNILLFPKLVVEGLHHHLENKVDYTYNSGYPRGIMFSEIISKHVLFKDEVLEKEKIEITNITQSVRSSLCKKYVMKAEREYYDYSFLNLSFNQSNIDKFLKTTSTEQSWETIVKEFADLSIPQLNFIINNICNISCVMCGVCGELSKYSKVKEERGNMSLENFKNIIDKFPKTKSILMQGGEILLNKDILDIIGYAREKKIEVNTITNGLLLDKNISKFLIENLNSIEFSIDSPEAETYESIRLHGKFDILIKNISEFMKMYNESKERTLKTIKINYVCMEQNYKQMPMFIDLMKKIGIDRVVFSLYAQYKYIENKELVGSYVIKDEDDFDRVWIKTKKIAEENNIEISMMKHDNSYQEDNIYNECNGIKDSFWITWDGYVLPCCSYFNPNLYNLGNIICEESNDVILNNWKQFRWNVFNNKVPKVCYDYCIY